MILFENGVKILEHRDICFSKRVAAGETLRLSLVCRDSGTASFDIDMEAEGADVELKGLYLCSAEAKASIRVNMRHTVGGSRSNQLFRGLVDGNARVEFDGRIVVAPDAQKTEAYQTAQTLQLSDTAVVQTSPQLEIYADDVKCSHGATVGSLNEDEQFYMRSRGISLEEARRLQIISFLSPVTEDLPADVLEEIYSSLV